ncbi:MAG: hypothetical protein WCC64_13810 [Aliidongia sp.]
MEDQILAYIKWAPDPTKFVAISGEYPNLKIDLLVEAATSPDRILWTYDFAKHTFLMNVGGRIWSPTAGGHLPGYLLDLEVFGTSSLPVQKWTPFSVFRPKIVTSPDLNWGWDVHDFGGSTGIKIFLNQTLSSASQDWIFDIVGDTGA